MWYVLPLIRKALAKTLIEEHGHTQSRAAQRLGLTSAAVSQYISGKRGGLELRDKRAANAIKGAAKRIAKNDDGTEVQDEICRLCKRFTAMGVTVELDKKGRGCSKCP
jgi:predicted transcriptional regulator